MKDLKNLKYLLPKTQKVLMELAKNDYLSNFVLVGGSALSLHLCHRKSEDLDFFTYKDEFNIQKIKGMLKNFKKREIVNIADEQIDFLVDSAKVTFFNAGWKFLEPEASANDFHLATVEQIAIMKTKVLFLRAKYRDYYDLYFLAKRFGIKRIFDLSKEILDGINFKLFATALLYIDDIEDENIDHLEPVEKITLKDIRYFFEKELSSI